MKVTKVSYRRGATLNVGEYESVKIEISADAELEEGDTPQSVLEALRQSVTEEIRSEALVVRQRAKARERRRQ